MSWRSYVQPALLAARQLGLDPKPIHFEEVTREQLTEIAAYGLPGMYAHWSHGRDYWRLRNVIDSGNTTIYELICNLDPCVAFLLADNLLEEQIFVISHCMGHGDLFKRNDLCASQRGDMDRYLQSAQDRFHRYAERYGEREVEKTIDVAHMLRQHVDPHAGPHTQDWPGAATRPYDDLRELGEPVFVKRETQLPQQRERHRMHEQAMIDAGIGDPDLLHWLINYAEPRLPDWKRDILTVVRETELYFLPQKQCKILHEGWASLWELRVQALLELPATSAFHDARSHAWVAGRPYWGNQLNPYWFGRELLAFLEQEGYDVFRIVQEETDQSLVRNWTSEAFVKAVPAIRDYVFGEDGPQDPDGRERWEVWRDEFVQALAIAPALNIEVSDVGRRRLWLRSDREPDPEYGKAVLEGIHRLTGYEISLETVSSDSVKEAGAS